MDPLTLSPDYSLLQVQETVAIHAQRLSMDTAKTQGEALVRMIDEAASIADASGGNAVNLFA